MPQRRNESAVAGRRITRRLVPRVSVVIPTLNEARNLPHVFARLPPWLHEVIVVDGGSSDGTSTSPARCGPTSSCCRAGRGKGSALGARLRRGHAATSSSCSTPTARPTRRRSRASSRRSSTGADFAKGSRFVDRRRQRRHHARCARVGNARARPARQRPLRHALHRPLLRLQRLLARLPRRTARRLRRVRGRDADQHPRREGRAARRRGAELRARAHPRRRATCGRSATAPAWWPRSSVSAPGAARRCRRP